MTIGIVGLGLIGASLAASFKDSGHKVLGLDKDKSTQDFAKLAGSIDDVLTEDKIACCDGIFIAVPPSSAVDWLRLNAGNILPGSIVMDCCGTKRGICREGFSIAEEHGFNFVGGHPMAGKQVGGYKNSTAELFRGAMVAIVPRDKNDIPLIARVKSLLQDAGFSQFAVMSPEEHDKIIAFTSQMAHLISNAYIKSDMAEVGIGTELSGGAFRDMTRVAFLDEDMWAELFIENRDNLLIEISSFLDELERYKKALEEENKDELSKLLLEGKERKKGIDANKQ